MGRSSTRARWRRKTSPIASETIRRVHDATAVRRRRPPPGNETPGSLPTVLISDLDGDRRYTGADVWLALQRCSKLGGCVLEAIPVTYDDVAISLYGQNDSRPCDAWSSRICEPMPPFPNGLVIQGHGSATVFRSPVWRTPYKPSPIFEFWHAPGVQLRFRNFVLDGRKREQPDPTPGKNDANTWRHRGIDVTHYFGPDHRLRYPDGCVHNVTARDFLGAGIQVDHARNWRIEYNRVKRDRLLEGAHRVPQPQHSRRTSPRRPNGAVPATGERLRDRDRKLLRRRDRGAQRHHAGHQVCARRQGRQ